VVDNNSMDGSVEKIKKEFPNVVLFENKINTGFSKAANQGAENSKGKYLMFLNPDTLFTEDSISKIYNAALLKKNLGALGPTLVDQNGSKQQSTWKKPTLLNTFLSLTYLDFLNYQKNYKNKKFNKISKVDNISGAAIFIPKNIFNKLEGFNENLFWMEDIDLCIRLNQKGYFVYYYTETKIIHFIGKSASKNYKVSISNQLKSKIKYFRIHHSKIDRFLVLINVLIVCLIKSLLLLFLCPFSKIYRKKLFAYVYTLLTIFED
jgi:GT2 family glycosyltransferase